MKTLNSKDTKKNYIKARKASWTDSDHFLSALDMATVKHDEAIKNSQIKRGELTLKENNEYVGKCRCGARGCLFFGSFKTTEQDFYRGGKRK